MLPTTNKGENDNEKVRCYYCRSRSGRNFSAYELVTNNSEIKVAVFEKGHLLEKRKCPIDGDKVKKCISCKTCSIMSGFGGAGAFSDGKYNITNDFGGTLYEHIGKKKPLSLWNMLTKSI